MDGFPTFSNMFAMGQCRNAFCRIDGFSECYSPEQNKSLLSLKSGI